MGQTDEKTPIPAVVSRPVIAKSSGNVLVIEDDKDSADIIGVILMREGYGVRTVATRDEALKILNSYLYDVIIMDLFMPGLGPKEFINEVRRLHSRSEVILMTAAENVSSGAADLKICKWLGKPFQYEDLIATVRSCT
jgi:DNA-binding response OmpR family regulator